MLKDGYKLSSGLEEAVFRNIAATKELCEITRTSLGPNGRNKLVVNHLEKLFLTNDAATIMKELDVIHPAAKLLCMAAVQQEVEMGDATNFVLVFAGELLQKGEHLLKMGLHPSEVIDGYIEAGKKAKEIFDEISVETVNDYRSKSELLKVVKSCIASKQYGYEDFFGSIIVDACLEILPKNNPGAFNVDSIRVVKILGASLLDTSVVRGMVFGREPEGSVTNITNGKIAIFSCGLDVQTTETKGTVLIKNAQDMLNFSSGEEKNLEDLIKAIADTGVKVVVSGSGIGELALHFFNRFGIMVVKILSKFDLRRLCRVTGATALARMGPPLPEELGHIDVVESLEIGSDRCTVFRQATEETKTATIVIRGATMNLLDDIERAIDDAVNTVKAIVSKDARLLAGAGSCEIEVAKRLLSIAEKTPGLAQYSMKAFAESLEVLPRTLAENSGMDSTEVVSKLYAAHEKENSTMGVDIESTDNGLVDVKKVAIYDSLVIKQSAIKLATSSAVTVLSIDQIIMSRPAGGPKPKQNNNWDED
ncbi:T-complex protein 1 subunit theta [Lobulomyces angularis]|nr:T-complex protein 1 subunit theta [Lobulomyces angularis]